MTRGSRDFRQIDLHDLRDPEPDPANRRYRFRIDIQTGRKTEYGPDGRIIDPDPPRPPRPARPKRACRTDRIIKELLAQGVTDPREMAVAAGVGLEAIRRRLRQMEEWAWMV